MAAQTARRDRMDRVRLSPRSALPVLLMLLLVLGLAAGAAIAGTGSDDDGERAADEAPALPEGALAMLGTPRQGLSSASTSVAFSGDGRILAVGEQSGRIWLWDPKRDQPVGELPRHQSMVQFLVFCADGERLVAGGGDRISVYDLDRRRRERTFAAGGRITALAVSPDGTTAAAAVTNRLILHDLSTGRERRRINVGNVRPLDVAFSPDGERIANLTHNRQVHFFRAADGEREGKPIDVASLPRAAVFTPDGEELLVGGHGRGVQAIEVATGEVDDRFRGRDAGSPVLDLAISGDGRIVAGRTSLGHVALWQRHSGEQIAQLTFTIRTHATPGTTVALSPDGDLLAAARRMGGHGFDLWSLEDGRRPGDKPGHIGPIRALTPKPDARGLISWGEDQQLIHWDLEHRTQRDRFTVPWDANHFTLAVRHGEAWAASFVGNAGHVTRIELDTGNVQARELRPATIRAVAFSPVDERVLLGDGRGSLKVRDRSGWNLEVQLQPIAPGAAEMTFTRDGRHAMVLRSGAVSLWRTDPWQLVGRFDVSNLGPGRAQLAPAPDGRLLAVATGDGSVRVIEMPAGAVVARLSGSGIPVRPRPVAFLPDRSDVLLTIDAAGAPIMHDLLEGEAHPLGSSGGATVVSLAVVAPSGVVAGGTTEGTILLWPLPEPPQHERLPLDEADRAAVWRDLGRDHGTRGFRATHRLAHGSSEDVAWLAGRIASATVDDAAIASLVLGLDDDHYAHREQAMVALAQMGPTVRPHVMAHLADDALSGEAAWRLEHVLDRTQLHDFGTPSARRAFRAVTALEMMNTPESRRLLTAWSQGAEGALLTEQAAEALGRLEQAP